MTVVRLRPQVIPEIAPAFNFAEDNDLGNTAVDHNNSDENNDAADNDAQNNDADDNDTAEK